MTKLFLRGGGGGGGGGCVDYNTCNPNKIKKKGANKENFNEWYIGNFLRGNPRYKTKNKTKIFFLFIGSSISLCVGSSNCRTP